MKLLHGVLMGNASVGFVATGGGIHRGLCDCGDSLIYSGALHNAKVTAGKVGRDLDLVWCFSWYEFWISKINHYIKMRCVISIADCRSATTPQLLFCFVECFAVQYFGLGVSPSFDLGDGPGQPHNLHAQ